MIDFRYHLVSLIAVFMALAVGIVIGAGPLRDYLAEELSGQVDQLRVEKDELREALDESEAARAQIDQFVEAVGPDLLSDQLSGRAVAVIQDSEADSDVVEAVVSALETSGAQIVSRTELTENWTDPAQNAFRSGIAGSISPYLNPQPADDASAEWVLGNALGQALTLRDPDDLTSASTEAEAMYALLTSSELLGEVEPPTEPAYATVVIGTDREPDDPDGLELVNANLTSTLTGLGETGEGVVVAGAADRDTDLITVIRNSESLSTTISTVDGVNLRTGQLTVPLALASTIAGAPGAFGVSASATAVIPEPVNMVPPDPDEFAPGSVDAPADDAESEDADADDTGTDDEQSDEG